MLKENNLPFNEIMRQAQGFDQTLVDALAALRDDAEAALGPIVEGSPPQMLPIPWESNIEPFGEAGGLAFGLTLVDAMATDDVASARLVVQFMDKLWAVDGSSKRQPADKPDHELGFLLALGRAVEKVGNQISRQASGRVVNNDNIRADRRERAKKKLADRKKAEKKAAKASAK